MSKKLLMTNRKRAHGKYYLRNRSKRRGAAMVEMAFVVAILLALTLGLIQWGLIMNASIALTNLSREGARYAAVHWKSKEGEKSSDELIRGYVEAHADANGIKSSDVTIAISPNEAARKTGDAIAVTVTYDMSKKLFLPAEFFDVTFFNRTFKAEGSMMME